MIEAKNSELKNIHGYSRCDAAGLSNMQLQGAVSIFAVNLKRILKLKGEVCPNEEKIGKSSLKRVDFASLKTLF